jgi:hypothetical protein
VNYQGVRRGINNSQLGATVFNLSTGCKNVRIDASILGARYGIRSGDYNLFSEGYNENITTNLVVEDVGYGEAHYLANDLNSTIFATDTHRAMYAAGVHRGTINASFKNTLFNAASIQVLVTDATTNNLSYPNGTSRGSESLKIQALDRGTTSFAATSNYCAGISLSRVDAGTTYEDIDFHVAMRGTDTIATKMSLFTISSAAKSVNPSYPFNWEQSIFLNNISLSGICDRSGQASVAEFASGNIIITTIDGAVASGHYATVKNLMMRDYIYIPGTQPLVLYTHQIDIPGLVGQASFTNCDFGVSRTMYYAANSTSRTLFNNCILMGNYPVAGFSQSANADNSTVASFVNCTIGDPAYLIQPNKSYESTVVKGTGSAIKIKIIDSGALTGSITSKTLVSAIPAGSVVFAVNAIVTTELVGVTGFEIGTSAAPTLYGNKFATTALGSLVTPVTGSTATTPINYPSFTNLIITQKGGAFTAGSIRVAIHYLSFTDLVL